MSQTSAVEISDLPVRPEIKVVPFLPGKIVEIILPVNSATVDAAVHAVQDLILSLGVENIGGLVAALAGKATHAEIATAVANLVASSPATLDTLKELADALGDDPNFATTIATALAGKQPSDDDLTAIAALSTTPFGRGLLTLAGAEAARTALDLATVAATGAINDLDLTQMPTSQPATPGVIWRNGDFLAIS